MVESGLTRSKNSINVAIKNLTDLGVSLIVYWAVGFAFMLGNSKGGNIGSSHFFTEFTGDGLQGLADRGSFKTPSGGAFYGSWPDCGSLQ